MAGVKFFYAEYIITWKYHKTHKMKLKKRVMGALNEVLQQTVFTQKQKLQQNKSIYKSQHNER